MAKKIDSAERAMVITTARRGVFFGYTTEAPDQIVERGRATIVRARMCNFWSKETHGVLGLAAIGPQKGSRIGPAVPSLTCESITGVMTCSDRATLAWESEVWS